MSCKTTNQNQSAALSEEALTYFQQRNVNKHSAGNVDTTAIEITSKHTFRFRSLHLNIHYCV